MDVTASTIMSNQREKKLQDTPPALEKPRTTSTSGVVFAFMMTPLLGIQEPFEEIKDRTFLIQELEADPAVPSSFVSGVSPLSPEEDLSEATLANRARLELLARMYAAKSLSNEEQARLTIATDRVKRLIPRITVEDFETLGDILEEVDEIATRNRESRIRLGFENVSKPF